MGSNAMNSARVRKATSRFDKNVTRKVATNSGARVTEDEGLSIGPILIAFFAFVVIGSSILEILRPQDN